MNLYKITADYRPNNPKHPVYFAYGNTKKEAQKRFESIISWLKIYTVESLSITEEKEIIAHPEKHIII